MKGTVTKKHFALVAKEFGLHIAFKLIFSHHTTALEILMKG